MRTSWSWIAVLAVLCAAGFAYAADDKPAEPPAANKAPVPENPAAAAMTETQRVCYCVGMQMATGIKKTKMEIDRASLLQGLQDVLDGKPTLMSDAEMKQTLMTLQQTIMAKRQEDQKREMGENKEEQKKFFEENGKKEGVVSLPSGLQYKVIKSGAGKTPVATDSVKVSYKGALPDGTEFDSSEKHGGASTFHVNKVVAGWTEALQLMKEGDKWQLFVPAELAYKDTGRPGIPPAKMLIFEVELIEVNPPDAQPAPGTVVIPPQPGAPPKMPPSGAVTKVAPPQPVNK